MLPSFVIIGAQKSGTTSLYHYLDEHPEVFMSRVKEPHFFAWEGQEYDLGGPNAEHAAWQIVSSREVYEDLFADGAGHAARGEASSGYLQTPHAADAMWRHAPDLRLIAILRNPVRRAHSAFLHARREGVEPLKDFEAALDAEPQRIQERWQGMVFYVTTGLYAAALAPYLDRFPPEQIRLYLSDDLQRDPVGVMQDVYRYVDVDAAFEPDVAQRHNTGRAVRSPAIHMFVRRVATRDTVRRALPKRLARGVYRVLNERQQDPLSSDLADRLATTFAPDLQELTRLMDRDLSPWLAGQAVPPPDDGVLGRHPRPAQGQRTD